MKGRKKGWSEKMYSRRKKCLIYYANRSYFHIGIIKLYKADWANSKST
jgi:hypothetical protein